MLNALETPALVLDANKLDRNVARMRTRLAALNVAFRPHVKTAKSIDVVRGMITTPQGPITVSTLKEADYFFAHGITDVLYAVSITPNKLDHIKRLTDAGATLTLLLDNAAAAHSVVAHGKAHGIAHRVLIEIDCDGHRSGVQPDAPDLIAIGQLLHAGGATLCGVLTHAGDSYNCRGTDAIRAMAEQERSRTVRAAERLRAAGLPCPIVSVGSTPTALFAEHLDGVTEVRAGVFVFFDLVMAGLNVCRIDDLALSVLTTVIGHQSDKGWIITDAGWMAMSRDRGTSKHPVDQGYGVVCTLDGTPIDDLIMTDANQEHGILAHRHGDRAKTPNLPVGTLLRILPNHACATGAQHDRYQVVRGTNAVEAVWTRFSGW